MKYYKHNHALENNFNDIRENFDAKKYYSKCGKYKILYVQMLLIKLSTLFI